MSTEEMEVDCEGEEVVNQFDDYGIFENAQQWDLEEEIPLPRHKAVHYISSDPTIMCSKCGIFIAEQLILEHEFTCDFLEMELDASGVESSSSAVDNSNESSLQEAATSLMYDF
ncbi:unnamed protein product [Orchesella dallaii]|uniref:Uncharacterized protein n=1 Tax=Orchesella dallaii TaxID=48710 RepID=A0ABP1R6P2_9HEXA